MTKILFLFASFMALNSVAYAENKRCDLYSIPGGHQQCGCYRGYCWAYVKENSFPGDGWCYTQTLGYQHGQEHWAGCKHDSECYWEMTCGNDTIHHGDN